MPTKARVQRRQGLQLLAKGEHYNDNSEVQRGAALMRQSDDAAREVRSLMEQTR